MKWEGGRKGDQFRSQLRSTPGAWEGEKRKKKAGTNLVLSSKDCLLVLLLERKFVGYLLDGLLDRLGEGSELDGEGRHGEEGSWWVGRGGRGFAGRRVRAGLRFVVGKCESEVGCGREGCGWEGEGSEFESRRFLTGEKMKSKGEFGALVFNGREGMFTGLLLF